MNLRRVLAVARKEFIHVFRDPRALAMGLAIPLLLLLLFGYALTLDVDNVPIVIADYDGTPASRELIAGFTGSRYFQVKGMVYSPREIKRALTSGTALLALEIPANYARDRAHQAATVQVIVDGSDANTATFALNYAESVIRNAGAAVVLPPAPLPSPSVGGRGGTSLELRARMWFNPALSTRTFIVPGLIAVILMVIAALLTSLTVAREWETGTMEQLLSTPLTRAELIMGKFAPYFVIGAVDAVVSVAMGVGLFAVPMRGSWLALTAVIAVFLIGTMALGLWISAAARNQLVANQIALLATFLPAFLLSGFAFDIASMPLPLRVLTHLVPARYLITLLRGIFLKGVGPELLVKETAFLTVFGVVMIILAVRACRTKLAG